MESAVDYGIGVSEAETPRGFASRLSNNVALSDADAEALTRLLTAVERLRFSPAGSSVHGEALVADVTRLRRAMATNATVLVRVQATLAPASVLRGTYSPRPAGAAKPL
jgi:hypothetical protein